MYKKISIKLYKSFFTESYNAQRDIYEIVEAIQKKLESLFIPVLKQHRESGKEEIIDKKHFNQSNMSDDLIMGGGRLYWKWSFLSVPFLESLNIDNDTCKKFIDFFSEKGYPFFNFYITNQNMSKGGSYNTKGKSIDIFLKKDVIDFYNAYAQKDYFECYLKYFTTNKPMETLVHELTHAYDDMVSNEKSVTQKMGKYISAENDETGYLQNEIEINARFYSAIYKNAIKKIQIVTSQRALKAYWERVYLPVIEVDLQSYVLTPEQQKKLKKRIWVEYATLDKNETEFMEWMSIQTMINNGEIEAYDVRLSKPKEVFSLLKNIFIDLSKGKISKNIFSAKAPIENELFQNEEYDTIRYAKEITKAILWQKAEAFHTLYKTISKYSDDNFYKNHIDSILKSLKLNSDIIPEIKERYSIA
jgi:hypothetical protein